jgi:CHAT domain-containing protein
MFRSVVLALAWYVTVGLCVSGDEPKKPQWQRMLTGDDAKRVEKLHQKMNGLEAADDYTGAITVADELLTLRTKIQGDDHHETVSLKHQITALRKLAALPPDKRGGWRAALAGAAEARQLEAKGRYADAQPLRRTRLQWCQAILGEDHPDTAASYNNLALNLNTLGKHAEAQILFQKALDICQRVLGEDHPSTAISYNNVAYNLDDQGKHAEAQPLYQKALEIFRKVLGEEHPSTATSYNNVAYNLNAQGKHAEAESTLERAIHPYESSRLAGASGLDRASLDRFNPRLLLAALRQGREPTDAWRLVELTLARGLLDQQANRHEPPVTPQERAEQTKQRERIAAAQPQILYLVSKANRTDAETAALESLLNERRDAEKRLATIAVAVSGREVASAEAIHQALPPDAALVYWVDVASISGDVQEHWVCAVRSSGDPKWERQLASGPDGKWSVNDSELPEKLRTALARSAEWAEVAALAKQLHAQRIAPVVKHLDGVKTLYVVPVNAMAGVPVELLTRSHRVSYVPSGTFLARAKAYAPLTSTRMLALGDPIFTRPDEKPVAQQPLPPGGILITQVIPGSVGAKARLQPGDVLLKYGTTDLSDIDRLKAAIAANEKAASIPVTVWREGNDTPFVRDVTPGRLGVVLDKDPAPVALANRRKTDAMLQALNRGGDWKELPGTRVETDRLRDLFGSQCQVLTDSAASERALESLRKSGELAKFRYLHFATHGAGNSASAFQSALILAQDKLPKDVIPQAGEPFIDGQLSAAEVLEFWKLDAELVTLSACETAVGKPGAGDGALGFAQAFLHAGSRSVCLSLWKVDDTATALLMDRFYQNLLGKRAGLTKPMGKAAALDEAKRWLRGLSGEEALTLTATMTKGVARAPRGDGDTRGKDVELKLPSSADPKALLPKDSKPFAHPKYWAAFILIGDPN